MSLDQQCLIGFYDNSCKCRSSNLKQITRKFSNIVTLTTMLNSLNIQKDPLHLHPSLKVGFLETTDIIPLVIVTLIVNQVPTGTAKIPVVMTNFFSLSFLCYEQNYFE
ncbi:unnamed protein product [Rodentolepis nana]|uniref:Ovule protein n=1 Tax=Rodentolepis nana TaxID=102285 RepID=A0A0R3TB75_RODNA|nr:unnamed protein product [Rodentolepis nana]